MDKHFEEMFLDAKLPADETEIAPELIEAKTNGYLYLKKGRVQKMYQRYQDQWKKFVVDNKVEVEVSDKDLVKFFKIARSKYAPSTLWVIYACLNAYFIEAFGVNLNRLPRLTRYLKAQTHLYVSKKSKCFSPEQIHHIMNHCVNNDDHKKTSLGVIVGLLYYGILRCSECMMIKVEDVKILWDGKIEVTFNHPRKRRNEGFKYWIPAVYENIFQRYLGELKEGVDGSSRFLKNYNQKSGKRFQNTGKNSINGTVKVCCQVLGISMDGYTSHAFRRSAATNLADAGVGLTNLKRHGQWKSPAAAEGYISNSLPLRREREQMLLPEALRNKASKKSDDSRNGEEEEVVEVKRQKLYEHNMLGAGGKILKVFTLEENPFNTKNTKTPLKENKALKTVWNPYKKRIQVTPTKSPKSDLESTCSTPKTTTPAPKENTCSTPKTTTLAPNEKVLSALRDSKATFNNCTFVFGNQLKES